ncbi:hypothetical protein BIV60_11965 [Bacillus sp. MUM 116]|uniref:conjugal transfer protein TrbL family protein n=1 Tax=Bacillus sp. MUM 116 TaxID=1678002 RepID=UPI0008F585E5|nr:conjugal transfer protein TrbL family protein [Bacillus sp. MUM 116]OIK14218.1 hypothetical protein BIV60_11965 [Bacillus sp. MUM 116]
MPDFSNIANQIVDKATDVANGIKDAAQKTGEFVAHPIQTTTEAIGNSVKDQATAYITDIAKGFGGAVLKWMNWFILDPEVYQNSIVDNVTTFFKWFGILLAIAVMMYHILNSMLRVNTIGDNSSYIKDKLAALIKSMVLIAILPWVIDQLVELCGAMTKYFTNKGINFENSALGKWLETGSPDSKLAEMMGLNPQVALSAIAICSIAFVFLFFVVVFQRLKADGEFAFLVATFPLAVISLISDELNVFSVWWREMIATLFTFVIQVILLYMIANCFATLQLKMIALGFGLCLVLISGPAFLRQFLYSTGTGRAAIGAAGSAGKVAIAKFILKGGK